MYDHNCSLPETRKSSCVKHKDDKKSIIWFELPIEYILSPIFIILHARNIYQLLTVLLVVNYALRNLYYNAHYTIATHIDHHVAAG